MKKSLKYGSYILTGIILGSIIGYIILYSETDRGSKTPDRLEINSISPDFSLYSLNGDQITLSDIAGTPVVINFWATWCTPCKIEMPLLQEKYDIFEPDLVILALDAGESKESVSKYIREKNITFQTLLDPTKAVQKLYLIRAYPTTYFIDKEGVIQAVHIGVLSEEQLERYLIKIGVSDG